MTKRGILFLLFVIFSINLVYAQDYITAEIEILDNGIVSINGESNIDPEISGIEFNKGKISGKTQSLTSKKGETWTFFLNLDKNYSEIFLKISFPDNTDSINSINSDLYNSINLGNKISIEIIDYNKKINFSVDYKFREISNYDFIILLILVLIIIVLSFFILKRKRINKLDFISDLLSEKENDIVKLLMKKSMRQKEIRKKLDIPKASFSRYMINLEKKKIIIREGEGKNKIVRLK